METLLTERDQWIAFADTAEAIAKQHVNHDRRKHLIAFLASMVRYRMSGLSGARLQALYSVYELLLALYVNDKMTHSNVKETLRFFADVCRDHATALSNHVAAGTGHPAAAERALIHLVDHNEAEIPF